ncbi:transposase InsO family protein [Bradyrhizobium sp. USDA 241]
MRGLKIERPDHAWAMDITYIPMRRGFVYLAAVVDVFSRRVLAHRVSITMEAALCVSAWNKDPVFGVIGIQSGPRDKGPQWLPSSHGSRGWDAGGGDDW